MFLATDPEDADLDKPLTQNGYNYVSNNPVMFVDRDGRKQSYQLPGGGGAIPFSLLKLTGKTKGTDNLPSRSGVFNEAKEMLVFQEDNNPKP